MTTTTTTEPRSTAPTSSGLALWASAFVLAALVILQAGRVFNAPASASASGGRGGADLIASIFEGTAKADVVSQVGGYTVMTFDGGNEDVLLVLDNRAEDLFIYSVKNQGRVEFLGREALRAVFMDAKLVGSGSGKK